MRARRIVLVLLLSLPVLALWGQTGSTSDSLIKVDYQRSVSFPMPGATAAYALNDAYADASAHDGWVTVVGKLPGSTRVVVVTNVGVRTLEVTIPQPPPSYPPGFEPPGPESRSQQRGSYEVRYGSDPQQWQNVFDFAAAQGDRSTLFHLSNVNYLGMDFGEGRSRIGLTNVSYEITTPGRQLTLADQLVTTSPLTLDGVTVRGFHLRQKRWEFHAGYSSMATFQNLFLPTDREAVVGMGYTFAVNDRFTITPQLYYFESPFRNGAGHTGGMTSLLAHYGIGRKLELAGEIGVAQGLAGAARLQSEGQNGERLRGRIRYQPRRFASLSTNGLRGLTSDFDWTRKLSPRWDSQSIFSGSRYFLLNGEQSNYSLSWNSQFRWSKRWTLLNGASVSRFSNPVRGLNDSGVNLQIPLGVALDVAHVVVSGQYQISKISGSEKLGHGARLSARTTRGGWSFGSYLDRQTQVPTMSAILSDTPGLQDLLERLGIGAVTPQQLAALLQDSAILESLGFASGIRLDLSLQNLQAGVDAGWIERGGARQSLNVNLLYNANQTLHSEFRSTILSGTYSRHLGRDNELFGSISLLRSGAPGTAHRTHPVAQLALRHNFNSVPPLLFPSRTGSLSGRVFEAPELEVSYRPGLPTISQVEIVLDGVQRVRTDREGKYNFRRVPYGEHQLEVVFRSDRPFYFTTPSRVTVNINASADFGITYSMAQLNGSVTNDAGLGLPGVALQVASGQGTPLTANTDGDGRFVMQSLAPGNYSVSVAPDSLPVGYDLSVLPAQSLSLLPAQPNQVRFVVRALRSIAGRVQLRDSAGASKPLSGWSVTERPQGKSGKTAADGRYMLRGLAAGPHTIVLNYGGREHTVQVDLPQGPAFSKGNDFLLDESTQPSDAAKEREPRITPAATATDISQALQDIFFAFGEHAIKPDQQPIITADAEFLSKHPEVRVQLSGYCDPRGPEEFNLHLGQLRAEAVREALLAAGIGRERLTTRSKGETAHFCGAASESCYKLQRRVHLAAGE